MNGTIPTMTPAEFARHLARAKTDGVRVIKLSARREDLGRVQSGTRQYEASLQSCTCKAGQAGTFCKHRALVLEMTGYADEVAPGYYEEELGKTFIRRNVVTPTPGEPRECEDCGDELEPDNDGRICRQCGEERDFKHGTGRHFDAFS